MPDEPNTLSVLASLLMDKGWVEEAGNLLLRAREVAPLSPVSWANLGRFLQTIGRWEQAERLYEIACNNFPKEAAFAMSLGQLYQRRNNFADAERKFRHALALDPDNSLALMYVGMTLVRQNRLDEAVETFNRAIEITPRLAAAYGNLGNARQLQGDMQAAEAAYEKAVELNPDDEVSSVSLGLVKLKRGASRDAAELFERALSGPSAERRAAAWFPFARAQELGQMPAGYRSEIASLITRAKLTTPIGFKNVNELNAALAEALKKDPTLSFEPAGKATRKGSQTGMLLDNPREPFASLEMALRREIDAHFNSLKRISNHPYLGRIPKEYHLAMWGTLLSDGGHQHAHMHVGGWMSGVYYISLPPSIGLADSDNRDGWIEFGSPPPEFTPAFEPVTVFYEPREGDALFFPSYYFHRTLPFSGAEPRISIAFDVKPVSWR
jgi:uncharacterized protein (TIGR02466 family)